MMVIDECSVDLAHAHRRPMKNNVLAVHEARNYNNNAGLRNPPVALHPGIIIRNAIQTVERAHALGALTSRSRSLLFATLYVEQCMRVCIASSRR
jgi:hypothetical protein